jgi:hypothetical protein
MKFIDDKEVKRAELNINGHKTMLDTTEDEYTKNIDAWLEKGNNYLRIKPKRTLQIVEVRIELKET